MNTLKNTFSTLNSRIRRALWLFAIRNLRKLIDAADDWTHTQEVSIRGAASAAVEKKTALAAVDKEASAQREKTIIRDRRNQTRKAARPRLARLVYKAGAFARVEQ